MSEQLVGADPISAVEGIQRSVTVQSRPCSFAMDLLQLMGVANSPTAMDLVAEVSRAHPLCLYRHAQRRVVCWYDTGGGCSFAVSSSQRLHR